MKKKLSILFAMLAVMVTTAFADNVISASDLTISKTGIANLTINLTNTEEVRGIQFTLVLPETLTKDEGKRVSVQGSDVEFTYDDVVLKKGLDVSTTDRTKGWTVVGNKTGDRTYIFVLISLSGDKIEKIQEGGSSAVMKISFQAEKDVDAGEYQVEIKEIHLSVDGSSEDVRQANTTAKLTVTDFVKGDVNGNGKVDIDDAVCILRHLVDKPNEIFNEAAADVNGNDKVDIDDAVMVLKYLVGKIDALSRSLYIEGDDDDDDAYDPD